MKKLFYTVLFLILLGFAACSKFGSDDNIRSSTDEHRISMQEALDELNTFYERDEQTRSVVSPQVATISTVKYSDIAPKTRSGSASSVGDLIYIANFEDEGYAILAADDRLTSIIAIIEQGNLTQTEFVSAANKKYDMTTAPTLSYIADYAVQTVRTSTLPAIGGWNPSNNPDLDLITYEFWKTDLKVGPLIPTKWDQNSPYNFYTPKSYAGCVAVAWAQYITAEYYKWRNRNLSYLPKICNEEIDWTTIFRSIEQGYYSFSTATDESKAVAWLIRMCGKDVNTSYGSISEGTGSSAKPTTIFYNLNKYGFSMPQNTEYNEDTIVRCIEDMQQPVLISGRSYSTDGEGGHQWIIDGIYRQSRRVTECKNNTSSTWTERRIFFHVNFGWGGDCDGYFYPGIFDLRDEAVFTESEAGDIGGSRPDDLYYYKLNNIIFSGGRRTDIL